MLRLDDGVGQDVCDANNTPEENKRSDDELNKGNKEEEGDEDNSGAVGRKEAMLPMLTNNPVLQVNMRWTSLFNNLQEHSRQRLSSQV